MISRLDPSVDDIAGFPEVRPQRHALSYALKQLVSHEIDLQRMRREEPQATQPQSQPQRPRPAAVAKESRDKAESSAVASQQPAGEQQNKEGEEAEEGSATPRHLQRLQVCLALRSGYCFLNSV